jgi:signal transduction histidine kinase
MRGGRSEDANEGARLEVMRPSAALRRLRDQSIKTKLLLMMLSLLLLSVSSLFLLHLFSTQQLLSQVREYTDDLSTAIEIAQEQPGAEKDAQTALKAYAEKLTQLGVKDVSIADAEEQVQASTNPKVVVGKPLLRSSKRKGPREYVIRGVLGEETGPPGSRKTSTLTIPIVVADRRVGYLVITRILDDFSALAEEAFVSRLIATLAVFGFGILLALYLSWSFSRPLQQLTQAAKRVAAGDLSVKVAATGTDETSVLARSFNEMVDRIRENRLLEERLHFAERSTAMGRLASAMAHEIRNPLNFVNLSIDHLREQLSAQEARPRGDFERILGTMKSEISRLNRLVGDFLSFGKPMRLDPRPCALEEVVREVAALVDHKARDQGIALAIETEEGLPSVVADAELLKTCFLNLMINGVDAMPKGGLLSVSVRRRAAGEPEGLVVEVSDTGHGMAPDAVRAAFEPYFSTKDTGLGLGLALTRKIVEDHGGSIALDSEPGRGTTVRIVLPLLLAQPAATPATEAVAR